MKRAADRQITKDNESVEFTASQGAGTFEKAAPDVLAKRRILKVRRSLPNGENNVKDASEKQNPFAALAAANQALTPAIPATSDSASSRADKDSAQSAVPTNPFAVLGKLPNTNPVAQANPDSVKTSTQPDASTPEVVASKPDASATQITSKDPKPDVPSAVDINSANIPVATKNASPVVPLSAATKEDEYKDKPVEAAEKPTSVVEAEKEKPTTSSEEKPVKSAEKPSIVAKAEKPTATSEITPKLGNNIFQPNETIFKTPISFGSFAGSAPMTFANAAASDNGTFNVKPAPPVVSKVTPQKEFKEAKVETGEEEERELFRTRAKLYTLESGENGSRWKERGVGTLKLKVHPEKNNARLVMRTEATLKVILNTQVYAEIKFDRATERSLRFQGFEEDEKGERKAASFLVRFATKDIATGLVEAVNNLQKTRDEQ